MAGRHAFFKLDPPREDYDNNYVWRSKAEQLLNELFVKNGRASYRAWWERTFEINEKTADSFTWREIYNLAQTELDHPHECGCVLPEQSCEVCRSIAHVISLQDTEAKA